MQKPLKLMNEMCRVLIDMERAGIRIDMTELDRLEKEYKEELSILTTRLEEMAREALGDTPFKLTSNDDLSMLIFSRRPNTKKLWAKTFNLGTEEVNGTRRAKRPVHMGKKQLGAAITRLSHIIYKTEARKCTNCGGTGKLKRYTKAGNLYKNPPKCPVCSGAGIDYKVNYNEIAGFKQLPSSTEHLAVHGYKCNKVRLEQLAKRAKGDAKEFLTSMVRFNAVTHYLTSFIKGIRENVRGDGILHTQFMQCITATGRLSSRSPNFHNQPRGGTFPIRKVVISRWEEGTLTEADYAQLEFRVAAALSKDAKALEDIVNGVDVHQRTSDILTEAGQVTNRQDAKTHTFKPLYGGTTGTKAEQAYYKEFSKRYRGISAWHNKILNTASVHKTLSLPSDRRFKFPWATTNRFGYINGSTKIKNYPVQGFATGDMVPLATILLHKSMLDSNTESCIINEVHDSIVIDTYPGEEELIAELTRDAMLGVVGELKERFNYNFTVPLAIEIKNGKNWLEMDTVLEV